MKKQDNHKRNYGIRSFSSPSGRSGGAGMLARFWGRTSLLLPLILMLHIYGLFAGHALQQSGLGWVAYVAGAVYADLFFFFFLSGCLFILYGAICLLSPHWADRTLAALCIAVMAGHAMLFFYFLTAQNLLGADLFHYSLAEVKLTVGAALSVSMAVVSTIAALVLVAIFAYAPRYIRVRRTLAGSLLFISLFILLFGGIEPASGRRFATSEFLGNLQLNHSAFFYKKSFYYLTGLEEPVPVPLFADSYVGSSAWHRGKNMATQFSYTDPGNFPFLHAVDSADVLSPFFRKGERAPDLVILIVEGLGRAFSGPGAYLGSFTPFIDSLATQSLYWENCLSAGGRTFAVLPSLIGSLPFGEHGFAEMGAKMPRHLGLVNILRSNGYYSRFIYAGDSHFDNMDVFMQHQGVDKIIDKKDFDGTYDPLPGNASGFSWGYGDFELYRRYFQSLGNENEKPAVNVLLTVSTHSPFLVPDQQRYEEAFRQKLAGQGTDERTKALCRENHRQLETVLYMDEAMKKFFGDYKKRPAYENTIFIITGDHRMPDIPMSTKIDRYHVPLIIYSPLLKRQSKFSPVISHLDVAPGLLAYTRGAHGLSLPSLSCWIGTGPDTTRWFSNRSAYALMQTKEGVSDYISGTSFLSQGALYRVIPGMGLEPDDDIGVADKLQAQFDRVKAFNRLAEGAAALYPDSLLERFGKED